MKIAKRIAFVLLSAVLMTCTGGGFLSLSACGRVSDELSAPANGSETPALAEGYTVFADASSGADENPGTVTLPVRTLTRAQELARACSERGDADVTVYLRGGRYTLAQTLAFDTRDSGKNGHTVTWCSYPGETAELSGGRSVSGWTLYDADKNIYAADAKDIESRDFFVNGRRAVLARTEGKLSISSVGRTEIVTKDAQLTSFARPQDLILVLNNYWMQSRVRVSGAEYSSGSTHLLMKSGAWATYCETVEVVPGLTPSVDQIAFAENALEFLDAEGEWYLDTDAGRVYYKPRADEDMNSLDAVLGCLEQLVTVKGKKGEPVENLHFSALQFSHSTWMQPNTNEGFVTIQANHYRKLGTTASTKFVDTNWLVPSAAVYGELVTAVSFTDNTFANLGNAGIHLSEGTKQCHIDRNFFTDCAGTGIMLSAFSVSYHNQVAGDNPAAHAYRLTENNSISGNRIDNVASVYNGGTGIEVGYARNTEVTQNTLLNLPYTAISFGWGWGFNGNELSGAFSTDENGVFWFSGNRICQNYINNIMTVLFDGGGIYTLGRNDNSVISGNYISDVQNDYGAIYLDNGSQGFTVHNNVIVSAHRNYIYKGDYNYIYDNYASPASEPDMYFDESIGGQPHYVFTDNYLTNSKAIAYIRSQLNYFAANNGTALTLRPGSAFRMDDTYIYVKERTEVGILLSAFVGEVTLTQQTPRPYAGTGNILSNGTDSRTVLLMGDVNGNGVIDSNDSVLIRGTALKRSFAVTDSAALAAADLHGNKRADSTDAVLLRRGFLGVYPPVNPWATNVTLMRTYQPKTTIAVQPGLELFAYTVQSAFAKYGVYPNITYYTDGYYAFQPAIVIESSTELDADTYQITVDDLGVHVRANGERAMRDAVTALRNVIESKSITGNCVIPASQLELSGTVAW